MAEQVHRLARRLGLLASGSTLLRSLRKRARPPSSTEPRVIGISEWAWKKGHHYGTIPCDVEQRRVTDLLLNRSTETVAAWLRQHPSMQVVSRDRATIIEPPTQAVQRTRHNRERRLPVIKSSGTLSIPA